MQNKLFKFFCIVPFILASSHSLAQTADSSSSRPQVDVKPIPLNWKAVKWPSLDYSRLPVEGGAALYSLEEKSGRKFKVSFIFPSSIYSFPQKDAVAFDAAADLILLGGAGKRNYDAILKEVQDKGIRLGTAVREGRLMLEAEGLSEDFKFTLSLLEEIILKPRLDADALSLWKQEKADDFESLLDASTLQKQYLFVAQEANKVGLGPQHELTRTLFQRSRKQTSAVKYDDVKRIAKSFPNRNGLNVVLSGFVPSKDKGLLESLMRKIPRGAPVVEQWLPGRSSIAPSDKVKVVVIDKPDMNQAAMTVRYFLTDLGELNILEEVRLSLASEVYSSTGGVIGNDRFSKAMRADSGISYSSHADFRPRYVSPNTNVGLWVMNYQSPNERIYESIGIALKTADLFLQKGISQSELERTRVARMNAMLSREETIFNKADRMVAEILRGDLPQPTPVESVLARMDLETNLEPLNEMVVRVRSSKVVPVLVLMGHPSESTLKQLRTDKRLEVIRVVSFENIKKEFQ